MHKRSSSHPPLMKSRVLGALCRNGDKDQVDVCHDVGMSLQGSCRNKGVVPAPWNRLGLLRAGGRGQGVSFRRVAAVGSCLRSGVSADISVTQRDVMEFP